jgi:hypothetical protein
MYTHVYISVYRIISKQLKSVIVAGELLGKLLLLLFFASIGTYTYMYTYIDICIHILIYVYTCRYICISNKIDINHRIGRNVRQITNTFVLC